MYFQWVGEASVSDSDSVLNSNNERIIRFCLGFLFKLGKLLPVSIMGMGSRFRFAVFKYGS